MEQAPAKRPGILTLTARAWRSAAAALLILLPVYAVVAAALFGLTYAFPLLEQKLAVIRPQSTSLFVLMAVPDAWAFGLEKLALGLVAAPAAFVTFRQVLAKDGSRLAPGPLLRFWFWAAALLLFSLGALYLAGLATTPDLQLVSLVLKAFAIALPILLLLVFPAVAAGEPAEGFAARMDKALERWDGNFWRFLAVLLLTVGPGLLLLRLPTAIVLRHSGGDADAVQRFNESLVGSALHAALAVVLLVIGSAAMAWCFAFTKLPKPAKQPFGARKDASPAAKPPMNGGGK